MRRTAVWSSLDVRQGYGGALRLHLLAQRFHMGLLRRVGCLRLVEGLGGHDALLEEPLRALQVNPVEFEVGLRLGLLGLRGGKGCVRLADLVAGLLFLILQGGLALLHLGRCAPLAVGVKRLVGAQLVRHHDRQ